MDRYVIRFTVMLGVALGVACSEPQQSFKTDFKNFANVERAEVLHLADYYQVAEEQGNATPIISFEANSDSTKGKMIADVMMIRNPNDPEWEFDSTQYNPGGGINMGTLRVAKKGNGQLPTVRVHLVDNETNTDLGQIDSIQGIGAHEVHISESHLNAIGSEGARLENRYSTVIVTPAGEAEASELQPFFKGGGSFDINCAIMSVTNGTIVKEVTAATSPNPSSEPSSDFKANGSNQPVPGDANSAITAALYSDPSRADRCMLSVGASYRGSTTSGMDVLSQVEDGTNLDQASNPIEDGNSDFVSLSHSFTGSNILDVSINSGSVGNAQTVDLAIGSLSGDLTPNDVANYKDTVLAANNPQVSSQLLLNRDSLFQTGQTIMPEYYNQDIVSIESDVPSLGFSLTEEIIAKDLSVDDNSCSYSPALQNAIDSGFDEVLLMNARPDQNVFGFMCAFGVRIMNNDTQTGNPANPLFSASQGDLIDSGNNPIPPNAMCPYGYNLYKTTGDVFDVDGDGRMDLVFGGGSELDLNFNVNQDETSDSGFMYFRNTGNDANCNGIPEFQQEPIVSATSVLPGIYGSSNQNDDQITDIRFVAVPPAQIAGHSGADAFVGITYENRGPRVYSRDFFTKQWIEIVGVGNFQPHHRMAKAKLTALGRGILNDIAFPSGHVPGVPGQTNAKGVMRNFLSIGTKQNQFSQWYFFKINMNAHPLGAMTGGIWHDIVTVPTCATKKDNSGDPIYPQTASFSECRPCRSAAEWAECGPDAPAPNNVGRIHNSFIGVALNGNAHMLPGSPANGYDSANHIPGDSFGDRTYYQWVLEKE